MQGFTVRSRMLTKKFKRLPQMIRTPQTGSSFCSTHWKCRKTLQIDLCYKLVTINNTEVTKHETNQTQIHFSPDIRASRGRHDGGSFRPMLCRGRYIRRRRLLQLQFRQHAERQLSVRLQPGIGTGKSVFLLPVQSVPDWIEHRQYIGESGR